MKSSIISAGIATCTHAAICVPRSDHTAESFSAERCVKRLSKRVVHYPNGHKLSTFDRAREHIRCCDCRAPAVHCEYTRWAIPTRTPTRGISFYYYCEGCWVKPGPSGSSPKERAMAASEAA